MFCQKCGTENPDDGTFCSKCGTDLKTTIKQEPTGKLLHTVKYFNRTYEIYDNKISFKTLIQTKEYPFNKVEHVEAYVDWFGYVNLTLRNNDGSTNSIDGLIYKDAEEIVKYSSLKFSLPKKRNITLVPLIIIVIAFFLISAVFLSTTAYNSPQVSQVKTPQSTTQVKMITSSPAEMLPTINDMPDGFMKGSGIANDTYASQDFINTGFAKQMLSYKVSKFSSIDKANNEYISIINTYSNYKLTDVHLGDESVGFELANSIATVVFRKANTVIEVQVAGQYTANLDDTISYAKKVRV